MNVKEEIQKTIQILKQMRKFKSQAEIAEFLNYNPSYFSRALNSEDIPMDLEESFFKAFPKSVYLKLNKDTNHTVSEHEHQYTQHNQTEKEKLLPKQNARRLNEGEDYIWIDTYKVPEKAGLALSSNYFAESYINELEKGKIMVKKEHFGKYWEVEAQGESMNDGTSRSLLSGDWYAARDVPREKWKDRLHLNSWNTFYFLHNERGHIIKEVVDHNPETGIIKLQSWNPDKEQFPDFEINVKDCYIIANIVQLTSRQYNIFYK